MLGQLLEDLRRPLGGGTDERTRKGEWKVKGQKRYFPERQKIRKKERKKESYASTIPSGSDPCPGSLIRCSSWYALESKSEHSSKSSLVRYSSDISDVLSDWSVVSERAWQLDGVSGRCCNLEWSDSMILSFCCNSLVSLHEHTRRRHSHSFQTWWLVHSRVLITVWHSLLLFFPTAS